MLFDEPYYLAINEARWSALQRLVTIVERQHGKLPRFIDLGCGPGWFAERLVADGRVVLGLEGRPELVEEARRRAPGAAFELFDFDAAGFETTPPQADAALCFGLLYHLENPLRMLRFTRAMGKVVFLESMTIPEAGFGARLVPENPNITQGIRALALIVTPEAVIAGLYAAGFSHVYRVDPALVDHEDFVDTPARAKRRDMFVAADAPLEDPALAFCAPPALQRYDFTRR